MINQTNVIENRNKEKEPVIHYYKMVVAGKKIEVECVYKRVFAVSRDYLATFEKPDFVISVSCAEIEKESARRGHKPFGYDDIDGGVDEYLEIPVTFRKIAHRLIDESIVLLHGAAVAVDGQCFIFTGPSGIGKTTHIKNWLNRVPGAFVVNGDKPFVDPKNKIVFGSPWCGKEGMNTNISVPLKGLISLEQGDHNRITRIDFSDILPVLLQQVYIPSEEHLALKVIRLIELLKEVPCYNMICNTEEESALTAYQSLCDNDGKTL